MGNTGYKSFASLELYYTDDNSSAGVTKQNINSDPDYIAPILDTATCLPSGRFYNTVRTLDAIKNDCSSGYTGSTVTLTANANQFMSTISQADANSQADAWLAANVQTYANTTGTCELAGDTTAPSVPTNIGYRIVGTLTADDDEIYWDASIDNIQVVEYEVYVSRDGNHIFTETITGMPAYNSTWSYYNSYARSGGTGTYGFKVRAKDVAGNVSAFSTEVFYELDKNTPAPFPTSLTASNITDTDCTLSWVASTLEDLVGYKVYKDNMLIATLGNVLNFHVTGLVYETDYQFHVTAFIIQNTVEHETYVNESIVVTTTSNL